MVVGGGSADACSPHVERGSRATSCSSRPDWRATRAVAAAQPQRMAALDESACAPFQWPGLESRRTRVQDPRPHVRRQGLGGGSTVNGMMALRAIPDDYDRWAAFGCPGWSYAEMLPYLRRMESDADFGDQPLRARRPIPVSRAGVGPADNALADAALGLGHPWCDDHSAPAATGVSRLASTRVTAA